MPTGATEPIVLDLPGIVLEANTNYFVAAVGTLANPSAQLAATSQVMMMSDEMMASDTIVDIAAGDGRFTTLVAALQAAGLVDTLKGEGPYTVFAPTDDAFAALPAGTVEGLLNDIPALTDVLLYHVVAGEVPAATVVTLDSATTLEGAPVTITVRDGEVFLNDTVKVIITDIQASNGIIHVIDGVDDAVRRLNVGDNHLHGVVQEDFAVAHRNCHGGAFERRRRVQGYDRRCRNLTRNDVVEQHIGQGGNVIQQPLDVPAGSAAKASSVGAKTV